MVGKDTQLPDLLILLGTMGGIAMFGILGFIIGPIVAALFVTIWEIYGSVFADVLPPGRSGAAGAVAAAGTAVAQEVAKAELPEVDSEPEDPQSQ